MSAVAAPSDYKSISCDAYAGPDQHVANMPSNGSITIHDEAHTIVNLTEKAKDSSWKRIFVTAASIYNGLTAATMAAYTIYLVTHGDTSSTTESLIDIALHTFNFGLIAVPFLLSKCTPCKRCWESNCCTKFTRGLAISSIAFNSLKELEIIWRKMSNTTTLSIGLEAFDFFINHPLSIAAAAVQLTITASSQSENPA